MKIDEIKQTLQWIFEEFGTIVQIIAKTNLKAKGQAFIVYENVESAIRAIDEVNGFEIFEKPMVLDFARSKSDATVLKEAGEKELEEYKKRRQAEKERRQAEEAAEAQKRLKRPATTTASEAAGLAGRPTKASRGAGLKNTSGTTASVIPDEYLPPNKILFLREIPDSMDQDGLTALFSQFPGFQEVRMVPGRKGIAFVEYDTDAQATTAKEATSTVPVGEGGRFIRITYQRQ
ncbi:Nucleotide-binding, alpha-beta plait [Ascosphaera apis ARSEF 7405]|uniref:Nucleotide-binding, alpha-beta plait n=1 Tax=Ascosphaera apis ARSEF 7405 TaxID=392613 RepID=A0A167X2L3_9EURO|nr:Nucleotide-binding, alpha-beta plait [Ascosphaera apis ARSEF 7405]